MRYNKGSAFIVTIVSIALRFRLRYFIQPVFRQIPPALLGLVIRLFSGVVNQSERRLWNTASQSERRNWELSDYGWILSRLVILYAHRDSKLIFIILHIINTVD